MPEGASRRERVGPERPARAPRAESIAPETSDFSEADEKVLEQIKARFSIDKPRSADPDWLLKQKDKPDADHHQTTPENPADARRNPASRSDRRPPTSPMRL